MSVEVNKQSGTYFVDNKPDNVPTGNIGGAGTHVSYPNKETAEKAADSLKDVNKDAVATATLPPDQGTKFVAAA